MYNSQRNLQAHFKTSQIKAKPRLLKELSKKMQTKLIITADGSHSLFIEELDEHYHSVHGAIQESNHVFIGAGLNKIITGNLGLKSGKATAINILEIGLGTGLNAFLTFMESAKLLVNIEYTAIEAYPVNIDLVRQLNYVEQLDSMAYTDVFNLIHSSEWEKPLALSKHFTLFKINKKLEETIFKTKFDLIYFDAFGPRVQPEMWGEEIFTKLFHVIAPGGCLVSYCAKGEVKRILKRVGFSVETLQGPPGKREMIRASKVTNLH